MHFSMHQVRNEICFAKNNGIKLSLIEITSYGSVQQFQIKTVQK